MVDVYRWVAMGALGLTKTLRLWKVVERYNVVDAAAIAIERNKEGEFTHKIQPHIAFLHPRISSQCATMSLEQASMIVLNCCRNLHIVRPTAVSYCNSNIQISKDSYPTK